MKNKLMLIGVSFVLLLTSGAILLNQKGDVNEKANPLEEQTDLIEDSKENDLNESGKLNKSDDDSDKSGKLNESTDLIELKEDETSKEESSYKINDDGSVEMTNEVDSEVPEKTGVVQDLNENNKTSLKDKELKKNTIYFLDKEVSYKNGGKEKGSEIIKDNKTASTWGGVEMFNGSDNKSTHFIGAASHQFKNLNKATEFIITDDNGKAFKYIVKNKVTVDKYGVGLEDGKDYWELITGENGGERVVFQTDINTDGDKLILEAFLAK